MNWGRFDLNLLAVFEAVMQERNMTRAGKRLGLSQPAVSHALARLRVMLKDDLLVRGPEGMMPTVRAEQLAGPIRDALASLEIALKPQSARPEDMSHSCTIAVNGYTAYALTNQIVDALRKVAPQLRLMILPSGTRDILGELDAGVIDLALTGMTDGGDRFKCSRVMTDHYVALLRNGHPGACANLSVQALAQMQHLTITSTGDNTSFLDECLEAQRMKRDIVLSLPFLAAPEALVRSDLVAIMPARVASRLTRTWDLVACPIACEGPQIELSMTWHRRLDGQEEHRWIRTAVRRCLHDAGKTA